MTGGGPADDTGVATSPSTHTAGAPAIGGPADRARLSPMRRLLDLYVAAIGLSLVWPLLALVAALIRLESPGSPFFTQVRTGLRGRPFRVYKFRTMRRDAPKGNWTVQDFRTFVFTPPGRDPRRTRIGNLLRATSIDEVPQLLNVLLGEMTLVGPRPEVPEVVAQYPPAYHHRHDVRPGITGLAQINGRSDLPYAVVMAYDLAYAAHRGDALDAAIILRTALPVLRREGAR